LPPGWSNGAPAISSSSPGSKIAQRRNKSRASSACRVETSLVWNGLQGLS
jgi:hypothetical protein